MTTGWLAALLAAIALFFRPKAVEATGPAPAGSKLHPEIRERVIRFRETAATETYGMPFVTVPLVLGLIARESGGISQVGLDGEIGLMQVSRAAWQDYIAATNDQDALNFPSDLESPNINIRVGSWFLSQKIEEMKSKYHGLRAYNCGARGARDNPTCGSSYAEWIISIGEPAFKATV